MSNCSPRCAKAAKIHHAHFLICGGPGETRATRATTFENSRRLTGGVIFGFAGMRIFPGTPLHERALREGVIQPDTDLLRPRYYISPALTEEELLAPLEDFKRRSPHWIVGPLWEFYGALQRRATVG